jgi:hypothetical protein
VRLGVGDSKANWNHVEEGRVGYFYAPAAEIVAGMEDDLEPPDARLVSVHQWFVSTSVRIGHNVGDELAFNSARQLVKLDPDAFRRPTYGHIEDMGRDASQIPLLDATNARRRARAGLFYRASDRRPTHRLACVIDMAAAPTVAIANCASA